jgi:AraC-like DNA-binding protein
MGSAIPSDHFSTNVLPERDQFDAWRDKISVIFDVARLGKPGDTAFEASVDAYQLGPLVVTVSRQGEQVYANTPKRIRRVGVDLFQVGVYRSGGYSGEANGISIKGRAGDLQILDLAQPIHSIEPASEMVCAFLSRELLQDRIGDLDGLHGTPLDQRLGGALADYLDSLAERLPALSDSDGEKTANAAIQMISACLRPTKNRVHEARSQMHQVLLRRAEQAIEANLRSPRLTPDYLCRILQVSRRSLYRLFEPLGGIHGYILRRRLSGVMRAIRKTKGEGRISDVAASYGFSCQETFWRAFKRRYGMTPGDARQLNSHAEIEGRSVNGGFDEWLKLIGT